MVHKKNCFSFFFFTCCTAFMPVHKLKIYSVPKYLNFWFLAVFRIRIYDNADPDPVWPLAPLGSGFKGQKNQIRKILNKIFKIRYFVQMLCQIPINNKMFLNLFILAVAIPAPFLGVCFYFCFLPPKQIRILLADSDSYLQNELEIKSIQNVCMPKISKGLDNAENSF